MQFSQILLKTYQELQFLLKLAEIWTRFSLHDSNQSYRGLFFENFDIFWIYAKIWWFHDFLIDNYHKSEKIKIIKKSLHNFVWNHARNMWSKFQPIWTKTVTPEKILVKFENFAFFHFFIFGHFFVKTGQHLKNYRF